VLFTQRFWPLIADGTVTVTFRRWKRCQVVVGHTYRTPGGIVEVDAVDVVDPGAITDADARRSGFASAKEVVANLRPGEESVYRVAFHLSDAPEPRLKERTDTEIAARLERLDRASAHGPWTSATLDLIAARPATRAGDLAAVLGRERLSFKADVRKLKNLGLTISLEIGYRLSPRGEAYRESGRQRMR
jgi:hypothetical protein